MTSEQNSDQEHRDKLIVERLADEYKILQDKFDKIGAFCFTIKGWAITITIGAIFAGATTFDTHPVLAACVLVVALVMFFFIEKKQTDQRRILAGRAREVEKAISGLIGLRDHPSSTYLRLRVVPGIAHELLGTRDPRLRARFSKRQLDAIRSRLSQQSSVEAEQKAVRAGEGQIYRRGSELRRVMHRAWTWITATDF